MATGDPKDQARQVVEEWLTASGASWTIFELHTPPYADLIARLTPVLRERDAQLEQAEAERDEWKDDSVFQSKRADDNYADFVLVRELLRQTEAREVERVKERDALVAAIQRGYCPDSENCDYGSPVWYDHRNDDRVTEHSPDCRVAPLLGDK